MPYTTTWRPFRDSDVEVELVWYEVPSTNPALPYPQFLDDVERADWWWQDQYPGEVVGAKRSYRRTDPKPLALGLHVCGTADDFARGGLYLPELPPVEYREDGLPVCCGPGAVGDGGGMGGGEAVVTPPPPVVGVDRYYIGVNPSATFTRDAGVNFWRNDLFFEVTLEATPAGGSADWLFSWAGVFDPPRQAITTAWDGLTPRAFTWITTPVPGYAALTIVPLV